MMRRIAAVLCVSIAVFGASCGYSTQSLLPEEVTSVAVDVFGNETFYREIEFQLTRNVSGQIIKRTNWKLTRRAHADAILTGRILSVGRPTLVENKQDLVSEQAVIVRAEVTLTTPDGRELDHFVEANRAEFIVERGETLETAFAECLADLAEQIINHLQHRSFLREMGLDSSRPDSAGSAGAKTAETDASPGTVVPK